MGHKYLRIQLDFIDSVQH